MATMSCFDGMYHAWGRIIAHQGVAVVMVDFRNCVVPSSAPEVAPFPAGLNDCVSGVKWVARPRGRPRHRSRPDRRRGRERRRQPHPRHGAEAAARRRPRADPGPVRAVPVHRRAVAARPQSLVGREQRHPARSAQQPRRGGLRHRSLRARGPAWPAFATEDDVTGLVPTVISVNECDPLRDEGVEFYRLLLRGRTGPVPSGHGHDPRHRDLLDRLSRHQPRHRRQHRPVLPHGLSPPTARRVDDGCKERAHGS